LGNVRKARFSSLQYIGKEKREPFLCLPAFAHRFRDDYWVCKRNGTIRSKLTDIRLKTSAGVPYIRPEIQLLYKGGSSLIREKDVVDLITYYQS
jgi:hypothetical protein